MQIPHGVTRGRTESTKTFAVTSAFWRLKRSLLIVPGLRKNLCAPMGAGAALKFGCDVPRVNEIRDKRHTQPF